MAISHFFRAGTRDDSPLDGSGDPRTTRAVSDFLTVQSLANFGMMTGAITAAWSALQKAFPWASGIWVPYVFAALWLIVSFLMSLDGLRKDGKLQAGATAGAVFIGLINALVLAGAVIGIDEAVT